MENLGKIKKFGWGILAKVENLGKFKKFDGKGETQNFKVACKIWLRGERSEFVF